MDNRSHTVRTSIRYSMWELRPGAQLVPFGSRMGSTRRDGQHAFRNRRRYLNIFSIYIPLIIIPFRVFVFHWRHSFHLSDWIGHFHSSLTIRVVFWIAYNDCTNQNAFNFMCQRYLCLVEQSKWIAILELRSNHEKQQRDNQHQQQWPANRFWRLSKANSCTWGTEC